MAVSTVLEKKENQKFFWTEEFDTRTGAKLLKQVAENPVPQTCVAQKSPTTCINFKELVLSLLKHQGWTINDVKFSDKGNLESINIKFSSEFSLGNSPWDPR